jgi:magnesium chelatase subunit H
LGGALLELEYTLIPHGLHVVGEPPDAAHRAEMLDAAGITEPAERARLDALLGTDSEIPGMLLALDGRYVHPAPGGDLLRSMDVLPTGRNLHGFDPFKLPSAFAMQDGARQAQRLLETLVRPRIDVVITLSGIFRDLLPLQVKLLAEAALLRISTASRPA